MSRAQLRRMITLESVVISVLGAVLGVVLGIVFGIALMYSLRDEGLEVISVPVGQLAIFLVLSLVIGVLAAVFRHAARPAGRAAGHRDRIVLAELRSACATCPLGVTMLLEKGPQFATAGSDQS